MPVLPVKNGVHHQGPDEPASSAFSITPSTERVERTTRALYLGNGGDITVTMETGEVAEFVNVIPGSILPIRVSHVTAASNPVGIVGLI